MTQSLAKDTTKRDIALNYLSISARKFADARGDYDESFRQLKALHHYLDLAIEQGCSNNQMMMALGYSRDRFNQLMRQAN